MVFKLFCKLSTCNCMWYIVIANIERNQFIIVSSPANVFIIKIVKFEYPGIYILWFRFTVIIYAVVSDAYKKSCFYFTLSVFLACGLIDTKMRFIPLLYLLFLDTSFNLHYNYKLHMPIWCGLVPLSYFFLSLIFLNLFLLAVHLFSMWVSESGRVEWCALLLPSSLLSISTLSEPFLFRFLPSVNLIEHPCGDSIITCFVIFTYYSGPMKSGVMIVFVSVTVTSGNYSTYEVKIID